MSCVSSGTSQKKGAVSYRFAPPIHCPPLAALSDDQREEFKPRWQWIGGTKWLETAPFFV
ncbi:hypothetical protein F240042I4_67430 [Eisenbergiella tayi]